MINAKKLSGIVAAMLCVLSCLMLCACKDNFVDDFSDNWGVELPKNMTEKFSRADDRWHGDGVRYRVYEVKSDPSELLKGFADGRDAEFETAFDDCLSKADFSVYNKSYLPDWKSEYKWLYIHKDITENDDLSEKHCYMVYDIKTKYLFICRYYN